MRKSKTIVVDGNHLMHRALNKFHNFSGPNGSTSIIFGFSHILQTIVRSHRPDYLVVVFDGGRDPKRVEILPDYKKRDSKKDFDYKDFERQREVTIKILTALRVPVIKVPNREADDFIWLVARRVQRKKGKVEIISADKDFNQIITPNIRIWNPYKNIHIHHKNLENITGYKPQGCVTYLSLAGDTSDNVPGLKGVGNKKALQFIEKYGDIPNYLNSEEEEKVYNKEQIQIIWNRREVIDIRYFCRKNNLSLREVVYNKLPNKINYKKIEKIARDNHITTFLKPEFIKTFERLKEIKL